MRAILRTFSFVLAATVILALTSAPAGAGLIVAQQQQDFQSNNNGHPDTIGSGTWKYMYSDTLNPTLGTTGMLVWDSGLYVPAPGDWYPDIGFESGQLTMAPEVGGALPTRYAFMRWTSGVSGLVNVTGTWTHFWNNGDGIEIGEYGDGVQLLHGVLLGGVLGYSHFVVVAPGSTIDFVVGPGAAGDGNWDRAIMSTTITMVPAPGAVLLGAIGAGFVGWLRRRRTL